MEMYPVNSELTHGRGYVYALRYHLVWCTKYRKPVFNDGLSEDAIRSVREVASDLDIEIMAMEVMPDHIHLLISTKPQVNLADAVKLFKGVTARHLFMAHPELKSSLRGGHLWNPSYYIETISGKSEERIRLYIETQTERNSDNGIIRGDFRGRRV